MNQPSVEEILDMVSDEDLTFEPGSASHYFNTNYLLLGLIVEKLSGRSFESVLRSEIIEPLYLKYTYCHVDLSKISSMRFPDYYFDPKGNGQLQNGRNGYAVMLLTRNSDQLSSIDKL